ncbi:hypothetical protein LPJ66_004469 [Kickxella alabastrina]|uniref:Uncharacterized protein n=1 Tax=Kickxella alabastrina TaxID=61397 RepID=A0ACC1IIL3_9FUNG|nr:hypothetical protein LPJ66_004469 [Kickxella alabastrina]
MPDELAVSAVYVKQTLQSAISICGGTILSPNHILTAAHCVVDEDSNPAKPASVSIGYNNKDTAKQMSVMAKKITIHPDYNHTATDGLADMAVIEVDTIVFGKQAQKMPVYNGPINSGQGLLPMGWGKKESTATDLTALKGVVVVTGNRTLCQTFDLDFMDSNGPLICTPSILTPNHSTCQGDSGTTVAVSKDDALMLVGLVSIAINLTDDLECGNVQSAHMYVHVAYFMDFLVSTTGLTVDYLTGVDDGNSTGSAM